MSPSFSEGKKILSWPVAAEKGRESVPSREKTGIRSITCRVRFVIGSMSMKFAKLPIEPFDSWNLEGGVSMSLSFGAREEVSCHYLTVQICLFFSVCRVLDHVDWPEIDEPSGSVVRLVGPGKAS